MCTYIHIRLGIDTYAGNLIYPLLNVRGPNACFPYLQFCLSFKAEETGESRRSLKNASSIPFPLRHWIEDNAFKASRLLERKLPLLKKQKKKP